MKPLAQVSVPVPLPAARDASGPRPLVRPGPAAVRAVADERARLRALAHELEGVFLGQLFAAMRATVPQDAAGAESSGREIVQSMLDERVAAAAARHARDGLAEALYRQLARRLPDGVESGGADTR